MKDQLLVAAWVAGSLTTLNNIETPQLDAPEPHANTPRREVAEAKPERKKPKLKGNCKGDADTPAEARAVSFCLAKKHYGWYGDELRALNNLWTWESGFDYRADNPYSTAIGIPQCLQSEHHECYRESWLENPRRQILWGLRYIKQREDYGSPSAAWWWHQIRSPHWY